MKLHVLFAFGLVVVPVLQVSASALEDDRLETFYTRNEVETLADKYEIYHHLTGPLFSELTAETPVAHDTFVEILLRDGSSICKRITGVEILLAALRWNRPLETLKRITAFHGIDARSYAPSTGSTPLHFAVALGRPDVVDWLINEKGAFVDLLDNKDKTAIDYLPTSANRQYSQADLDHILATLTGPSARSALD